MMNLIKIIKQKLEHQNFDEANKYWPILEDRLNNAMPVKKNNRKFLWLLLPIVSAVSAIVFISNNNPKSNLASINKHPKIVANNTKYISNNRKPKNTKTLSSEAIKSDISNNEKKGKLLLNRTRNINNIEKKNINKLIANNEKIDSEKIVDTQINFEKNELKKLSSSTSTNSIINNKRRRKSNQIKPKNVSLSDDKLEENLLVLSKSRVNDFELIAVKGLSLMLNPDSNNNERPVLVENTNEQASSNAEEKKAELIGLPATKGHEDYTKNNGPKTNFSINVYGGANYIGKRIFNAKNPDNNYTTRRKQEEKNNITSTFGLDLIYTKNKWSFTSGINYHSQSETRNYNNKFYRNIEVYDPYWESSVNNVWEHFTHNFTLTHVSTQLHTSIDTISYYDSNNGSYATATVSNTSLVVDTDIVTHTVVDSNMVSKVDSVQKIRTSTKRVLVTDKNQTNLVGKNTITYLEVPILVGYQMQYNKLSVAIKTGIGLGVLTSQNTYYITNDLSTITEIKPESYNRLLYNYILRLSFTYNINKRFGIYIEPSFRANINSVLKKDNKFQQKYYNAGSNIGLNYKF